MRQTVDGGAFMALARGVSPVDGSVLRVVRGASTVAAIDLTFSVPKRVSVLFAVADDLLGFTSWTRTRKRSTRRWDIWSVRRASPGGVYRVIGAAPTARAARAARAARGLRDTAGVPAGTIHALIGEVDRARGFPQRTVLVIDEAGMAPTRVTAALSLTRRRPMRRSSPSVIPGQLASVQAGGWLGALAQRHASPELRRVIRQRDPGERAALEALHDGHPDRYLETKQGAIAVHPAESDAVEAVVDQWDTARRLHGLSKVAMITRANRTREQLNHAARGRLRRGGTLPDRGVRVAGREYAPGDPGDDPAVARLRTDLRRSSHAYDRVDRSGRIPASAQQPV